MKYPPAVTLPDVAAPMARGARAPSPPVTADGRRRAHPTSEVGAAHTSYDRDESTLDCPRVHDNRFGEGPQWGYSGSDSSPTIGVVEACRSSSRTTQFLSAWGVSGQPTRPPPETCLSGTRHQVSRPAEKLGTSQSMRAKNDTQAP